MIRKHFKPTKNPKTTQKRARQKSLANSTTTANSTANGTTTGGPANDKLKRGQLKPLQVRADAAGIDIGSQEIAVAVPPDRDPEPVRTFPTFTVDLESLADWLEQCGVRTVAMESTSVYWIPLFQILEKRGLEVFLVNAHPIKNVSGRPTDVGDCQWIQQPHAVGLLRTSFRPPREICAVRAIVRHRQSLTQLASQAIEHMRKSLDQMNLHLHYDRRHRRRDGSADIGCDCERRAGCTQEG